MIRSRSRLRLRHLLAASALLLPLPQARAAVLQLPREVPQGGLVIGRAPAACRVSYDGRDLRVGADGRFAFGVGRDAEGPLQVRSACPGHPPQVQHIAVRSRTWPTERVNGVPPKTVRPPPAIAARMARERKLVAAARTRNDAREDFEEGFVWPVHGRISGRFGSQRIYNGVPRAPHSGVDIAVPRGTPVKAPAAGIVTLAKRLYLSGNTVIIDHGFGVSSVMLHMDKLDVTPGQRVRQGQIVGLSGMTGRATGPHVHWGMNWFGVRLDPRMVAREHPANTHRQARRKSAQTAD